MSEFEIYAGEQMVAGATGPRADAWVEAMNYASMYATEGVIEVQEITRRVVPLGPTPPDGPGELRGSAILALKLAAKTQQDENSSEAMCVHAFRCANTVLCDLLRALGYGDVVDEWEKVEKWYA